MKVYFLFLIAFVAGCMQTRGTLSSDVDSSGEEKDVKLTWTGIRTVKDCTVMYKEVADCFSEKETAMNPFVLLHRKGETIQKTRYVIVLVHGMTDSPYMFRDIAMQAFFQGFNVVAPLLDGHGTQVEDLTIAASNDEKYWVNWLKRVESSVQYAGSIGEKTVLGGFSLGGALVANYAQKNLENLAALALFSPALQTSSVKKRAIKLLMHSESFNSLKIDTKTEDTRGADFASVRYDHLPGAAIRQLYALQNDINEKFDPKIPTFMAISQYDTAIDQKIALRYLANNSGPSFLVYFIKAENFSKYKDKSVDGKYVKLRTGANFSTLVETHEDLPHASILLNPEPIPFTLETNLNYEYMGAEFESFLTSLP